MIDCGTGYYGRGYENIWSSGPDRVFKTDDDIVGGRYETDDHVSQ